MHPAARDQRMAPPPQNVQKPQSVDQLARIGSLWQATQHTSQQDVAAEAAMRIRTPKCAATRRLRPYSAGHFAAIHAPPRATDGPQSAPFCTLPKLRHRMGADPAGDSHMQIVRSSVGSACRAELRRPGPGVEPPVVLRTPGRKATLTPPSGASYNGAVRLLRTQARKGTAHGRASGQACRRAVWSALF